MDFYTKALEFFVENNIQLNEQQLEALNEKKSSAFNNYIDNDIKPVQII